jgi:hypothetical protein
LVFWKIVDGKSHALSRLDRRLFLRASGVAIGLLLLDAMLPASAAESRSARFDHFTWSDR